MIIACRAVNCWLDVSKWAFTPATRDGRKIVSTVEVPVEFKLDEQ